MTNPDLAHRGVWIAKVVDFREREGGGKENSRTGASVELPSREAAIAGDFVHKSALVCTGFL